jgi:hypothetical protein
MANALQGVATLFGAEEGAFFGVAGIAALLGFIATLLAYFSARAMADPLRIVKFYVVFTGVFSLFFGYRVPVQVQDDALNKTYVVQKVPYPVAYVLSFITQVEDAIAKQVDRAFSLEGHYCGSQNMGIFACSQITAQAMDMRVVDPYLYLNLTNFFQDCVFTNILDGTLDANILETSKDLYGLIFEPTLLHPARFTVLYDGRRQCTYPCNVPCGGGCSMTCVDAAAHLRSALSQWVNGYGFKVLSATVGQTVLTELLNVVPTQIMHLSQMGTGFLMQSVLINQFKETYRSWAASYGMGLTEQGIFTKGQIEKATANRYLPLINGILHVLFASLVPVLVIFMLTPLMKGALMFTFIFGLWMIVWKFTEAVVNGFFYSKLERNFQNFASASQGTWGLDILNAPVISALLVDHISLAGSLYWLVPTVSFVVASLGGYAFHSFATGLGGVIQSTAQASAGDVARGNFNAGQVNYRNVSAGNKSFGNFSGWTMSAFTGSVLQESNKNIRKEGKRTQVIAGQPSYVNSLAGMLGDKYTQKVVGAVLAIAGYDPNDPKTDNKINVDTAFSPHGRLEYIVARGGIDGFIVEYRGGGNIVVYSRGVEHGNIMLDEKGEIIGPGRLTKVGDIALNVIQAKQKEIAKKAEIYGEVAKEISNFHSIEDEDKRRESFIRAFERLLRYDSKAFKEVIEELGMSEVFEELIKQAIIKQNSRERTKTVGVSGELSLKFSPSSGSSRFSPIGLLKSFLRLIPTPEGKVQVYGKYERSWKHLTTLSNEDVKNMLSKLYSEFKERYRTREGTTTSSATKTSHERGFETSKSFKSGKIAEVAEKLFKRANEALQFAKSLSVNMIDNPLNAYYQQKFMEGLEQHKYNRAKAIRYAHERLVELISDENALKRYIEEYAASKGLEDLWEREKDLIKVFTDVPTEPTIENKRKEIEKEVEDGQGNIRRTIEGNGNKPKNPQNPEKGPQKGNPQRVNTNQLPPEAQKVLEFLRGNNNNGGPGNTPHTVYSATGGGVNSIPNFNPRGGGGPGNTPHTVYSATGGGVNSISKFNPHGGGGPGNTPRTVYSAPRVRVNSIPKFNPHGGGGPGNTSGGFNKFLPK